MQQSHKLSFYVILATVFLLPLFFIPGGALAIGLAKSAILIFGVVLGTLVFTYELWGEGSFLRPKHAIMAAVAALPLVYLLSALLATPSSFSLFGYGFEAGTFGYMLLGTVLLVLISSVFADTSRILQAFSAFFISFAILSVFVAIKIILGGDALSLGNFFGNTGNPLGNWTDLSVAMGLVALLSALTIGMIPMKPLARGVLYIAFFLSAALLIILSFSASLALVLASSFALVFYMLKAEKRYGLCAISVVLPVFLGLISLVFLVNPNISGDKTLSSVVSETFVVNNTEVRPSLSATLSISKAVLSQVALLGSGPNTFGRDWLIYKDAQVNATPFWGVAFPTGVGFLPTQIATTGILGSALWLAFFVLFITLGVKTLSRLPESRAERFTAVFSLLAAAFLWAASFVYAPSGTMLVFAFVFTGLFLASILHAGIVPGYLLDLKRSSSARLARTVAIALVVIGALAIGWVGYGKTVAAYHFNKAVKLSNVDGTPLAKIEESLNKAIKVSPEDIYFVALSRLNFSRAQMAANSATGTPEENKAVFDESVKRSIEAARLAVSQNPGGFENWAALGGIYSALVPKPIMLEGAYESALYAYNEAARRNPSNPELPMLFARLELNKGDIDKARSYIRNSIALKEDYADAYIMLAQLEEMSGNTTAAIASAEKLAILLPDNAGIHFELGLLKYSSGNYDGAASSFNKALALSKDYANAKYYLGLSLAHLGRFAEERSTLEELLPGNSDNVDLIAAVEAVKKNKIPPEPKQTTASQNQ